MKLLGIELDEGAWHEADEARRREWRIAIDEVLADPDLKFITGTSRLWLSPAEAGITLRCEGPGGEVLAEALVSRDALSRHVREYVDIVRQMERADLGLGAARLEALDMAKKLTHDDAARTLTSALAPLGIDHATGRRLFTLLFTLRVDTSRLTGVRGHRPVR